MSKWKLKNPSPRTSYMRDWLQTSEGIAYREKHKEYARLWRIKNKKKFNDKQKENYMNIRLQTYQHYCKGKIQCNCCGEDRLEFLTLDHINGNGSEHRRQIDPDKKIGGNGVYYWLKKNNWPEGFQILCCNCNFAKRQNKCCPHQSKYNVLLEYYI